MHGVCYVRGRVRVFSMHFYKHLFCKSLPSAAYSQRYEPTMNQCVLSRQSLELQPVQLHSRHTDTKRQAVSSLSLTLELPDMFLLSTSFAYFDIAVFTRAQAARERWPVVSCSGH